MKMKVFTALLTLAVLMVFPFSARSAEEKTWGGESREKVLEEFSEIAESARKEWQVPGMAVSVVQGDRVIFARGYGVRRLGKEDPVTPETLFQIGSISKSFSSALVAMEVDAGRLEWDRPVADYLPEFRLFDPWVTREFRIFDLMAQRSGLPPHGYDLLTMTAASREEILRSLQFIPPMTSFRSEFAYQNSLFLVAGLLVEKTSGKSWEENIRERIFKPLGMVASSAGMDGIDLFRKADNGAWLHRLEGGKTVVIPMDWPFLEWPYLYGPAGGINSTVLDMAKWVRFQLGKGTFEGKILLDEENALWLRRPSIVIPERPGGDQSFYCQGWVKTIRSPFSVIWHNGQTSGAHSYAMYVPELDLGFVVLTNTLENPLPEILGRCFYDLWSGAPRKDWFAPEREARRKQEAEKGKEQPSEKVFPPLSLVAYEGTYTNPAFGELRIFQKDGELLGEFGTKMISLHLRHRNRDIFEADAEENQEGGFPVLFSVGLAGTAESLILGPGEPSLNASFDRKDEKDEERH